MIRRHGTDIVLGILAFAALVLGGGAVMTGLGRFVLALLPDMTAKAGAPLRQDSVHLTLGAPFAASRHAPQVLFPVVAAPFPAWMATPREPSAAAPVRGRPVIAICIDDLGQDIAGTDRAILLPRAVAMSFLPYADATPFLATEAARRGHAILAHVPMQPLGSADPGPMALTVGMAPAEIARRMDYALNRVPGIIGINNHEGSRFTADAAGLVPVMTALKAHSLFFFDSRTSAESKVAEVAAAAGVQSAGRDVFLDDDPKPAAVAAQLERLVQVARRNGIAIAIGHPHAATLDALAEWLKHDHGVTLVPLPEAMRLKEGRAMAAR